MLRTLSLPLVLAVALIATGCASQPEAASENSSDPQAAEFQAVGDVTVEGDAGAKPTLQFSQPFVVEPETTQVEVLDEAGDGEVAELGDEVVVQYVGINGRDGAEFDTSYEREPATFPLTEGGLIQGFLDGLVGQRVGSRVLLAIPGDQGYGPQGGNPEADIEEGDTLLFVVEILQVLSTLSQADGTPVEPPPGLPAVTVDDTGRPTITVPEAPPPAELTVAPLLQGSGTVVAEQQTVTAHFTIVTWPGGRQVATSFDTGPTPIPLGSGAIPGLEQALVGQAVGTRLLVVVPPDQGFGAAGNPELGVGGADTLVIVIDLLGVR